MGCFPKRQNIPGEPAQSREGILALIRMKLKKIRGERNYLVVDTTVDEWENITINLTPSPSLENMTILHQMKVHAPEDDFDDKSSEGSEIITLFPESNVNK